MADVHGNPNTRAKLTGTFTGPREAVTMVIYAIRVQVGNGKPTKKAK